MKYFLISDNVDTLAGLRMAGVAGVVAHEPAEVKAALQQAAADETVGLVLVTSKLFGENRDMLFDFKLHAKRPLLVEMPDRHGGDNVSQSIKGYIADVVGIKI